MFHGDVSPEIARGLLELRRRIDLAQIPSSALDESINVATWNIRVFGGTPRSEAALHYIAEIIGQFDLVNIVELRDDLSDLERVLDILGPYWRAVYSDYVEDPGGNYERVAFVYDKRAVVFNGFAANATPTRRKRDDGDYHAEPDWWRPPYLASFCAGNFDFVAVSAHIRWGTTSGRLAELSRMADWVERKRAAKHAVDRDWLVMGDFNIPSLGSALFQAISKHGLRLPAALVDQDLGSNLARNKRYDQILHLPQYPETFSHRGGVLDFHLGDEHIGALFPDLAAPERKTAYTYQMSDHLPLWIQLNVAVDGFALERRANR